MTDKLTLTTWDAAALSVALHDLRNKWIENGSHDAVRSLEALSTKLSKVQPKKPSKVHFGPVVVDDYGWSYKKEFTVQIGGKVIGTCYREPDMIEWACDGDIEARFGMSCFSGYTHAASLKKAIKHAIDNGA